MNRENAFLLQRGWHKLGIIGTGGRAVYWDHPVHGSKQQSDAMAIERQATLDARAAVRKANKDLPDRNALCRASIDMYRALEMVLAWHSQQLASVLPVEVHEAVQAALNKAKERK